MTANERKSVARVPDVRSSRALGRTPTTITGVAAGSADIVTLGWRDWDKIVDALRSAARYLHDPPDPALLRIADDIERKLPKQS
jgi:hypothetical protein